MVCDMATKNLDFRINRLRKSGLKSLKSSPVYIFGPNLMIFGYCIHHANVSKILLTFFRTGSSGSGNSVSLSVYSTLLCYVLIELFNEETLAFAK